MIKIKWAFFFSPKQAQLIKKKKESSIIISEEQITIKIKARKIPQNF